MSVKIKVKTSIFQETGQEIIELAASGQFYQKGPLFYLQYEEEADIGRIRTIVKWSKEAATILRSGAVKMRMPLVPGENVRGHYQMPFGVFETSSFTKKMNNSYNDETGVGYIDILYDFSMQGSHAGTYHLEMMFQEEKQ